MRGKDAGNDCRPMHEVHDGADAVEEAAQGKQQQFPVRMGPSKLVVAERVP